MKQDFLFRDFRWTRKNYYGSHVSINSRLLFVQKSRYCSLVIKYSLVFILFFYKKVCITYTDFSTFVVG